MGSKVSGKAAVWGCGAFILLLPLAAILRGLALSVLWGWFVQPVLHTEALSVPFAMGIAVIISLFSSGTHTSSREDAPNDDASFLGLLATGAFNIIATPLVALAIGAIIHAFV